MKHIFYTCPPSCDDAYCSFCRGGLSYCTTCGLGEGSLTTDCCGRKATREEERLIYEEGVLDFRAGQWVNPTCDDLFGLPVERWRVLRRPAAYAGALTGGDCSVCGKPQFTTPSGPVCENGHGGAPTK